MAKIYKGEVDGNGVKAGIVVSRFNEAFTYALLADVQKRLIAKGVLKDDISIVFVPGAMEIPQGVLKLLKNNKLDVVYALGAVIQGETPHFEHVSHESIAGVQKITMMFDLPIVNGILAGNTEQIQARTVGKRAKGVEFADTGLEMVSLMRKL